MLAICNSYQKTIAILLNLKMAQKGTTLIEMLLAMSLSSLVISALCLIMGFCGAVYERTGDSEMVVYAARCAGRIIEDDLRRSFSAQVYDNSRLIINLSDGGTVEYYLAENQIYRDLTNSNGTTRLPITENITQLYFTEHLKAIGVFIKAERGQQNFDHRSFVHPRASIN